MNALKEPFTLTRTQFSSADSISTHSRHLTSNINTFQAESNNNKYSFTTNLFRANVDPS